MLSRDRFTCSATLARIGNHLVLEPRVELHVPCLVHLLRGQEARFLLGSIGAHQSGEFRGDPLVGDHQGCEDPVDPALVRLSHPGPLLPVT